LFMGDSSSSAVGGFQREHIYTRGMRYRLRGPARFESQERTYIKVRWEKVWPTTEAYFRDLIETGQTWFSSDGTPSGAPTSISTVTLAIPPSKMAGVNANYSASHDVVPQLPSIPENAKGVVLVTERLLPVEVRMIQTVNGPHGSAPMYATPQPLDGNSVGELFSLWPTEKGTFVLAEPLAGMIIRNELPAGFVKWSNPDPSQPLGGQGEVSGKADVSEFEVKWAFSGLKEIKLEVGTHIYNLNVNIPATGQFDLDTNLASMSHLQVLVGTIEFAGILSVGVGVRSAVETKYGENGGNGGTRQDAIRHSTWNAASAENFGKWKTIMVSTANERRGRYHEVAFSSNSTMDLYNNNVGANAGELEFNTPPNRSIIESIAGMMDAMETKFSSGELWAWTPPNSTVWTHANLIRKSNQIKIFGQ
jgi:hypothetical protein